MFDYKNSANANLNAIKREKTLKILKDFNYCVNLVKLINIKIN